MDASGLRFLWLLLELGNLVILVCYHQAETGSILPRHFHDCDQKILPLSACGA